MKGESAGQYITAVDHDVIVNPTIGGDHRVFPWRNAGPAAARDLGLDADVVTNRVDELTANSPDAFRDAADADAVRKLGRELPRRSFC